MSNVSRESLPARARGQVHYRWTVFRYNQRTARGLRALAQDLGVTVRELQEACGARRGSGLLMAAGLRPLYLRELMRMEEALGVTFQMLVSRIPA